MALSSSGNRYESVSRESSVHSMTSIASPLMKSIKPICPSSLFETYRADTPGIAIEIADRHWSQLQFRQQSPPLEFCRRAIRIQMGMQLDDDIRAPLPNGIAGALEHVELVSLHVDEDPVRSHTGRRTPGVNGGNADRGALDHPRDRRIGGPERSEEHRLNSSHGYISYA